MAMQLGVLEYLISVKKSSDFDTTINKTDKTVKNSADKISAWTIAKGKLLADFTKKALTSTANMTKQLVKGAVSAYADFEQLEGGVKKLFGSSYATVISNAKKAYMTAGLSANEYMETVTSFSASLISSLGGDTKKAAEVADMALTDMADNVNTFGSSMESVSNAYKGFSKQNFTMLDNLKLGYGGTRKEMERLLKDAEKVQKANGKNVKYNIQNLNDIYEAIHVIQQEMNISGTTKKEASSTISGSIASAKAAWANVLTALGSGRQVKQTVTAFTKTLTTVFKNVRPVAIKALQGLIQGMKTALPELGKLMEDVIEELEKSDSPILQTIAKALKGIRDVSSVVEAAFKDGIPGAIKKLREMDTPLSNIAAGALETLYNICNFFVEHVGIENTISIAIGAFLGLKGLTIASSVLAFLDKLAPLKNASFNGLTNVFGKLWGGNGGGNSGGNPTTPNVNPTSGKPSWMASAGGWISSRASLLAAGGGVAPFALLAGLLGLGYAGASMINANLNDPDLNAIYGTTGGENDSVIDTMSDQAVRAVKAYFDVYEKTGTEEAMDARDNLFDILAGEGYKNTEAGVTLIEDIFDNMLNETDPDGLGEKLKKRFAELGVGAPIEPTLGDTSGLQQSLDEAGLTAPVDLYPKHPSRNAHWNAKGNWNVPYDNYPSLLHRGEMVLTASQARQYREGNGGDNSVIVSAIQGLRNDLTNLQLVVGRKTFGKAVVDYGGSRVGDYIGGAESRLAAGYGT